MLNLSIITFDPRRRTTHLPIDDVVVCALAGGLVMRRRDFLTLFGGAAATWPAAARAQQPAPATPRQRAPMQLIGILSLTQLSPDHSGLLAFRRGLVESGFIEGKNISLDLRAPGSSDSQLQPLAEDLLRQRPAVIVAVAGPGPVLTLKAATSTVPIVFISGLDPINQGFVASFNRPAGNLQRVPAGLNRDSQSAEDERV